MRLPVNAGRIDEERATRQVRHAIDRGGNLGLPEPPPAIAPIRKSADQEAKLMYAVRMTAMLKKGDLPMPPCVSSAANAWKNVLSTLKSRPFFPVWQKKSKGPISRGGKPWQGRCSISVRNADEKFVFLGLPHWGR